MAADDAEVKVANMSLVAFADDIKHKTIYPDATMRPMQKEARGSGPPKAGLPDLEAEAAAHIRRVGRADRNVAKLRAKVQHYANRRAEVERYGELSEEEEKAAVQRKERAENQEKEAEQMQRINERVTRQHISKAQVG